MEEPHEVPFDEIEYQVGDGSEPLLASASEALLLPEAVPGAEAQRSLDLSRGPIQLFLVDGTGA
ncbi:MAG TPA: hypothetical protein VFJ72_00195 [Rubrobacteraceae bacterium]|nr:hypothetical protein [Rubrobacteraceae bacterium]